MKKSLFIKIIISVIICTSIGGVGAIATQSSIADWYVTINKPSFNPPNWIFGPVWTVLYIMMGIAVALVWHKGVYHKWVQTSLYHFGFQLILNAMWSVLFFGMRQTGWALIEIFILFIMILFTIRWFKVVDKRAAYLLIPYVCWVAFASILNFEIWRLN